MLFEAIRFFKTIPIQDFLFGLEWNPQTAIRADQLGAKGEFGAVPLITGTLLISTIAMLIATPLGLTSSIYLAEMPARGHVPLSSRYWKYWLGFQLSSTGFSPP